MQPRPDAVKKLSSGRFPPTIQDIVDAKEQFDIQSPSELWHVFDDVRKAYFEKKSVS